MITRIVKMIFVPEHADDFQQAFKERHDYIISFDGCLSLRLLRCTERPNIFFTYSTWKSAAHLEAYRQSELFRKTWARVKPWFSDKAQAWTVNEVI